MDPLRRRVTGPAKAEDGAAPGTALASSPSEPEEEEIS